MSRSYKKTPYCRERKGKRKKRAANGHIRQLLKKNPELNLDGAAYKRHYERWEICDYSWRCNWDEYWKSENEAYKRLKMKYPDSTHIKPPCKKEAYKEWIKMYRNK